MELVKFLTLQWLHEIPCHHISSWTIINVQFTSLDSVSDEVVSDGDVICPFADGLLTVFLYQYCTLVILVENCFIGVVSLPVQKIVCPQNVRHQVVGRNYFCLF